MFFYKLFKFIRPVIIAVLFGGILFELLHRLPSFFIAILFSFTVSYWIAFSLSFTILNPFFTLSPKLNDYSIGMRVIPFLKLVRRHNKDKSIIREYFTESFYNAAKEAIKLYPREDLTFSTVTWLLCSEELTFFENHKIVVIENDYPKRSRVILCVVAFFSYGSCSECKKIMERPFYKITWTRKDLERFNFNDLISLPKEKQATISI